MAQQPHTRLKSAATVALRAEVLLGLMATVLVCSPAWSWDQQNPAFLRPAARTTVAAELLSEDQIGEQNPSSIAPRGSPMQSLETSEEPGWVGPPQQEVYEDILYEPQPIGFRRFLRPLHYSLASDGRSRGIGNPLSNESWLNRPYHVDFFAGGIFIPHLLSNRVDAGAGFLYGARFGWDGSHFWGIESRIGNAHLGLSDPIPDARLGNLRVFLWDASWLYYPLGDTQWRPYFSLGTGLTNFDFVDNLGTRTHDVVLSLPISIGMKYRIDNRMAFRVDLQDHLTFASGNRIDTINSLIITSGIEFHFGGGPRKSYWPWAPSRTWW